MGLDRTWAERTYITLRRRFVAFARAGRNTFQVLEEVERDIVRGAQEYAALLEPSSRTSVRARVLGLIERFAFRPGEVTARQVSPEELTGDSLLRGAVHLHVDLVFRAALSADELLYTAAHGWVFVAYHESMPRFPVGVALALPAARTVRARCELFDDSVPNRSSAKAVVIYSIATNPPRLGAGAALIGALKSAAQALSGPPSLVAFSPLTGMRARIIRLVDDSAAWAETVGERPEAEAGVLREQLVSLLSHQRVPDDIPEPARGFLLSRAHAFARSSGYRAGTFHRSMGARLIGLAERGDPCDGESMWLRAYHEYDLDAR